MQVLLAFFFFVKTLILIDLFLVQQRFFFTFWHKDLYDPQRKEFYMVRIFTNFHSNTCSISLSLFHFSQYLNMPLSYPSSQIFFSMVEHKPCLLGSRVRFPAGALAIFSVSAKASSLPISLSLSLRPFVCAKKRILCIYPINFFLLIHVLLCVYFLFLLLFWSYLPKKAYHRISSSIKLTMPQHII